MFDCVPQPDIKDINRRNMVGMEVKCKYGSLCNSCESAGLIESINSHSRNAQKVSRLANCVKRKEARIRKRHCHHQTCRHSGCTYIRMQISWFDLWKMKILKRMRWPHITNLCNKVSSRSCRGFNFTSTRIRLWFRRCSHCLFCGSREAAGMVKRTRFDRLPSCHWTFGISIIRGSLLPRSFFRDREPCCPTILGSTEETDIEIIHTNLYVLPCPD